MRQKIFDIYPPQPPTVFQKEIKKEKAKSFFERITPSPISEKRKWWGVKKWWAIFLLFLILAGFLAFFTLPRAEIKIWPEIKNLNFQEKVVAETKVEAIDRSRKIIPAKAFGEEQSFSQEFLVSGKKEKRAEGTIRVYNNYSTSPQVLVATTRFVSAEGKLFRTPTRITIPGGNFQEGKLVPGFVDIRVVADQPGQDYNIGPTTFSIPGFAGTPKYTAFYGKSFEPMKGGGGVFQVTKEDLEKAEKILIEKARQESKTALTRKIPSDFILLEGGIFQEIVEATSSQEAGAEVESFTFQVKVKSQLVTFRKSDLENLARGFITSQITHPSIAKGKEENEVLFAQAEKFQIETLKMDYSAEPIDLKSGKIILNLAVAGKIYFAPDEAILKEALKGKSREESQIFLENEEGIIRAQIKTWPFWVKRIPEKIEKIKIKINLD